MSITSAEPTKYCDAAVMIFQVVAAVSTKKVKLAPMLFKVLGSLPGPDETGSAVALSDGRVITSVASLVRIIRPA